MIQLLKAETQNTHVCQPACDTQRLFIKINTVLLLMHVHRMTEHGFLKPACAIIVQVEPAAQGSNTQKKRACAPDSVKTDLHEDWALQGATCTLPTPVLWWPVASQEQKVYIWQAVMLSHIQQLQLDIAVPALCVVPVDNFTGYVHLP